jgi:ABC-type branched-subunit amino acid transport system substrate-binding protein
MDASKQVQSTEYRVQSKTTLFSQTVLTIAIVFMLVGCAGNKPGKLGRVALLAPFEGRYREVGYNAYYAAKLAFHDYGGLDIELVAVDDGGTVVNAADRARALAGDPLVRAVIALGKSATNEKTQKSFSNLPVVIVGYWGAKTAAPTIFMLSNPTIADSITLPESAQDITAVAQINAAIIGGDVLSLQQFPRLNQNPDTVTVVSSGNLPDTDFVTRYLEIAAFTPQPGVLATLTYDATLLTLQAVSEAGNGSVAAMLATTDYAGLNGDIRFENGYWVDAPLNYFEYDNDGALSAIDSPVE